jgi:hypothetical protein
MDSVQKLAASATYATASVTRKHIRGFGFIADYNGIDGVLEKMIDSALQRMYSFKLARFWWTLVPDGTWIV